MMKTRSVAFVGLACVMTLSCTRRANDSSRACFTEDQMDRMAELDRTSLAHVPVRPSKLASGGYVLETTYPGEGAKTYPVHLDVAGGRMTKAPQMPAGDLVTQDFTEKANVVSWSQFEMPEGPSAKFVGLVDGSILWGRAYVGPGKGWQEGRPPAIGFWKIYPRK